MTAAGWVAGWAKLPKKPLSLMTSPTNVPPLLPVPTIPGSCPLGYASNLRLKAGTRKASSDVHYPQGACSITLPGQSQPFSPPHRSTALSRRCHRGVQWPNSDISYHLEQNVPL